MRINKDIWPTKNWKKYLANTSNAKLECLINEADLVKLKGLEWLCTRKQDRQCTYNITLRRVCATIVVVEMQ